MHAGKRVVGLASWELSKQGEPVEGVLSADTPEEAVELALA
jgi:hypothetical protein